MAERQTVSYPLRDLNVQHEEMHVFLSFVQRQRLGDHCDQHGCAGYTLKPTQKKTKKMLYYNVPVHKPFDRDDIIPKKKTTKNEAVLWHNINEAQLRGN